MDRPLVTNPALLRAATDGLARPQKEMSPKWLYDEIGSEIFEEITVLPEYYPTRTEREILETRGDALAAHVPEGAELVELGSGASVKTRLLLDRLKDRLSAYVPVDISQDFLNATARDLAHDYPGLTILPVTADFTRPLPLEEDGTPRVAFFPGSTLGNLDDAAAESLLSGVADWPGIRAFILGIDLVKDRETLVAAYDDSAGVTARFNLNLLARMNREIGADFDLDAFEHRAVWNDAETRIEMHLVSLRDQSVHLNSHRIDFAEGETIHTENSRKFTPEGIDRMAARTGWRRDALLTDDDRRFAVAVLVPESGGA